jgi:branched-chain amino acid transport system permease protein
MLRQELKKLAIYSGFLAVILIPMVGFRGPSFEAARAFAILGVCIAILIMGTAARLIRANREAPAEDDVPWSRRVIDRLDRYPKVLTLGGLLAALLIFPQVTNNYVIDVGITCLIYVCLGLGLNIVVGLCGLLDLGYIAFYAVGAYTYSLLNLTFGLSFWAALPIGVVLGMICGCIIGYPTLKMRGDYLAIVTLGFGEIIRLVLNNWDELTAGPTACSV